VSEMRRVTKPGGIVAACVWDGDNDELHTVFWDAAAELDPEGKRGRDARAYGRDKLSTLWNGSGFTDIKESALVISPEFKSFDEFWLPLLGGQGSGGSYFVNLPADTQLALRARVREKVLGKGSDRPFRLKAGAWAVRGVN
jgi:hypothetical protein